MESAAKYRCTFLFLALVLALPCRPQTAVSSPSLPKGVLTALAHDANTYCEDQFAEGYREGCHGKFAGHLRWRELTITPSGQAAILVENDNLGFCGVGGCDLYLFVQRKNGSFAQVLGGNGGLGTLERVSVSKKLNNGHYNIRVRWSDGKTYSTYEWADSQYWE